MKRIELTPYQLRGLACVTFLLLMILFSFVILPFVLPFFGVKQVVADLSSVMVPGLCYVVIKLRPTFFDYTLPDIARWCLQRCGVEVVYVETD